MRTKRAPERDRFSAFRIPMRGYEMSNQAMTEYDDIVPNPHEGL